jgi:hypothetical protein
MINKNIIEKSELLRLLAEEGDAYASYLQLCERYQITPNPTAEAIHQDRKNLLTTLLNGKPTFLKIFDK